MAIRASGITSWQLSPDEESGWTVGHSWGSSEGGFTPEDLSVSWQAWPVQWSQENENRRQGFLSLKVSWCFCHTQNNQFLLKAYNTLSQKGEFSDTFTLGFILRFSLKSNFSKSIHLITAISAPKPSMAPHCLLIKFEFPRIESPDPRLPFWFLCHSSYLIFLIWSLDQPPFHKQPVWFPPRLLPPSWIDHPPRLCGPCGCPLTHSLQDSAPHSQGWSECSDSMLLSVWAHSYSSFPDES